MNFCWLGIHQWGKWVTTMNINHIPAEYMNLPDNEKWTSWRSRVQARECKHCGIQQSREFRI